MRHTLATLKTAPPFASAPNVQGLLRLTRAPETLLPPQSIENGFEHLRRISFRHHVVKARLQGGRL